MDTAIGRCRLVARRAGCALAAFAVAAALGACGGSGGSAGGQPPAGAASDVSPAGDIPDTQAFVAYSAPGGAYQIKVPEGWARTDLPNGALFTGGLNSVRVQARPSSTPPTEASVRATELPSLGAAAGSFRLLGTRTASPASGEAVAFGYRADGPRDAVTGKHVVQDVQVHEFWRSGTLVALVLASPRGADNVDPWRLVTNSFAWAG